VGRRRTEGNKKGHAVLCLSEMMLTTVGLRETTYRQSGKEQVTQGSALQEIASFPHSIAF
jgi:hypothetical protein